METYVLPSGQEIEKEDILGFIDCQILVNWSLQLINQYDKKRKQKHQHQQYQSLYLKFQQDTLFWNSIKISFTSDRI